MELILRFFGNIEVVTSLLLQVQVYVVKDLLGAQIHSLHSFTLEDELGGLADEELTHRHELLLSELLFPVVDLSRCVCEAGDLEQFGVMFNIW